MADTRISELTELAGASVASGDEFVVVDKSDTTMAASGTDKKITAASLAAVPALVAAFDPAGSAASALTAAAALVDDLSGVTNATTARANIGAAPLTPSYLTLGTNGELTNERVLTAGSNITLTDGGAGSTLTIAASGGIAAPGSAPYADIGGNTKVPMIPGFAAQTTSASLTLFAGQSKMTLWHLDRARTLDEIWINCTGNIAGSGLKAALVTLDADLQPSSLILNITSGGAFDTATTGVKKVTGINTSIPAGLIGVVHVPSHSISLRAVTGDVVFPGFYMTDPSLGVNGAALFQKSVTYASWNPLTAWDNLGAGAVRYNCLFPVWSS